MACEHLDHEAEVSVFRLVEKEGDESATHYVAEVRIKCADDCGKSFGFKGLALGSSPRFPTTSPDTIELRAPLFSPTELALAGPVPYDDSALGLVLELARQHCYRFSGLGSRCVVVGVEMSRWCLSCRARELVGRREG